MTQSDLDAVAAGEVSRDQVIEGIYLLLPAVLGREPAGLSADTGLTDGLGMESTVTLELILRLEDLLEVEVSVETLDREHLATIGTLADYISANLITEDED